MSDRRALTDKRKVEIEKNVRKKSSNGQTEGGNREKCPKEEL
ncbi:hypothetical protein [Mesobacillus jeotgali]|nr:hypothetical protein [Mesobacillus jeotgali]